MPHFTIPEKMLCAVLPGDHSARLETRAVPTPGHGEVLLRMKASTICGSDIRCIYHEHLGKGPEGYQPGMIAGHEPCGQIVQAGPGCRRFKTGDRVIVYHISGCGVCNDCRRGYMISCTSEKYRRAYGWQRDGGMAEFLLAEEKDLLALPDSLSYADGAQVACGFGTVYEGLEKIGISGNDAVLVTGLGPVGLAAAALARKLGARQIIGIEALSERIAIAQDLRLDGKPLFDHVLPADAENVAQIRALTGGNGTERTVECSANAAARNTAIRATRKWGKMVMLGEGGTMALNPSPDMLHDQKTLVGSWVTSTWKMEELVERLVHWDLHPAMLITHRFPLEKAAEAYALMATGKCGKVAVCFDEELPAANA
ncbi:MAG: zinc-binding dehydrogenase [Puniceicoccales bacterium]|jgi:threonine dehydrogenase-like Zn-dependent dehydrogenase|nr:zinc-binding dehydrogenase [Puniceicoccales bacterium]